MTVRGGSLSERGLESNGGLVAERGVEAVGVVDVFDEGADATAGVIEVGAGLAVGPSRQLGDGAVRSKRSAIRRATSSTLYHGVNSTEAVRSVGPPVSVMMKRINCRSSQP